MVRIVSGQQEQDPGLAFLAGYNGGQEQKRRNNQDQRERARLMLTIQRAMGDYASEQQRALADVNARAQMGDAMALQQQMLEAQAADMPPEQKMIQEFTGALGKITDEKARAKAVPVLEDLLVQAKAVKEKKVALEGIQRAGANGLIDPALFQQRMDAGEDPAKLHAEALELEQKLNLETMAATKNAESLAQMQALVEAFPEGPERLQGEYALTAFQNDQTALKKPGEGARRLQELQKSLLEGQQRMEAEDHANRSRPGAYQDPKARGSAIEDLRRKLKADPSEKEIRSEMRYNNPNAGKVKRYGDTAKQAKYEQAEAAERTGLKAKMKGAKPTEVASGVNADIPSLVTSALDGGAETTTDLVNTLMQAGVSLTPENLEAARAQLKQYKTGKVAAAGGVEKRRVGR